MVNAENYAKDSGQNIYKKYQMRQGWTMII